MEVTLREIWALAREHARMEDEDEYLPTIDKDHNERFVWVERMQVQFHIDNSDAIYYEVGDIDDLVYLSDGDGRTNREVMDSFKEFESRVTKIARDEATRFE